MNMKIEELLKGEEKLRKYKELKQWKDLFETKKPKVSQHLFHAECAMISCGTNTFEIPESINKIIVSALGTEIKKLDEE